MDVVEDEQKQSYKELLYLLVLVDNNRIFYSVHSPFLTLKKSLIFHQYLMMLIHQCILMRHDLLKNTVVLSLNSVSDIHLQTLILHSECVVVLELFLQ